MNLNLTISQYIDCLGLSLFLWSRLSQAWVGHQRNQASPRKPKCRCATHALGGKRELDVEYFESCAVNPQWHIISAAIGIISLIKVHVSIQLSTEFGNLFKSLMHTAGLFSLLVFFSMSPGVRPRKPSQATAFHYLYRYSWWEMMGDKSLLCNRWSTNSYLTNLEIPDLSARYCSF